MDLNTKKKNNDLLVNVLIRHLFKNLNWLLFQNEFYKKNTSSINKLL